MLEEWLAAIGKKYKINIVVTKGDNHFVSKTYDIIDPMGNGLGFRVAQMIRACRRFLIQLYFRLSIST